MLIVIIVLILCIIIFTYKLYKDKFIFINVKLNNIEEKINSTLITRKELIKEAEEVIKEVVNTDKQIFEGISKLDNASLNMMELDKKLLTYINEFYLIKDKYKKLQKNDNFKKIDYSINETEDKLNAYKEYYNDTAQKYNKLINTFPIIIVAKLKRRKAKLFFDKKSLSDSDYNNFKY